MSAPFVILTPALLPKSGPVSMSASFALDARCRHFHSTLFLRCDYLRARSVLLQLADSSWEILHGHSGGLLFSSILRPQRERVGSELLQRNAG